MGERKPLVVCSVCRLLVVMTDLGEAMQHYPQGDSSRKQFCVGSNKAGTIYP